MSLINKIRILLVVIVFITACTPAVKSQRGQSVIIDDIRITLDAINRTNSQVDVFLTLENNGEHEPHIDTLTEMKLVTTTNEYSPLFELDGNNNLNVLMEEHSKAVGKVRFTIPENEKIIKFIYAPKWNTKQATFPLQP